MLVDLVGAVIDGNKNNPDRKRVYVAKVAFNYKGETNVGEYILISTPLHSCGVRLSKKGRWLVSMTAVKNGMGDENDGAGGGGGGGGLGVYEIQGCDFYQKWLRLTKDERTFLSTRMICDDKGSSCTCGHLSTQPDNCFIEPCRTSQCHTHNAKCINNYCGGCRAEWIDARGWLQCQCMSDDTKVCPFV